ncbi:hypothetical protein [Pararhizobium sp. PWRC1-1]|uniref:hypothetical protein n=1 Tax=Pararhizobium sp. PWRC1-1 TaxID=2804566 RepID=UPI003CE7D97C
MDIIETDVVRVVFDPEGGVIAEVIFKHGGRQISPLHKAPWVRDNEQLNTGIPLIERKLAGDFFCAPFALPSAEVPLHGWTANGDWAASPDAQQAGVGLYRLRQNVQGGLATKEIRLHPGHPVVYQTHTITGGTGTIPIAHHTMLHVPGGVSLSFSDKRFGSTGPCAPETDPSRGRSILAYPQTFDTLSSIRKSDGSVTDASRYPFETRHEDVVVLTEKQGASFGWSAALAAKDGFIFFSVKDALVLPHTVLWMSNGGRAYPPWSGRHTAVLGIEEAAISFHLPDTHTADMNVALGLDLAPGRTTKIRYAFGAIEVPSGWTRVSEISLADGVLIISDEAGRRCTIPFDCRFLDYDRNSTSF